MTTTTTSSHSFCWTAPLIMLFNGDFLFFSGEILFKEINRLCKKVCFCRFRNKFVGDNERARDNEEDEEPRRRTGVSKFGGRILELQTIS